MLSQSSASSLLRWSCAHWLKRVASVLSDVPLLVATLRAESWALIRVLRSAQLVIIIIVLVWRFIILILLTVQALDGTFKLCIHASQNVL